jgi:4-hydroxybenzoate polyprenyltransferase
MDISKRGQLYAWLQLLRLPNVFTAIADVAMGYLVTHGDLQPPALFALIAIASCLLYLSGMVLNDVFDAEVDAFDRPERAIPSGRISSRAAALAGWALLASGVLAASFASFTASNGRPALIAILLALSVVLYDGILKRTPLAPLVMGACRTLNVLLGMSLAPQVTEVASPHVRWGTAAAWLIAAGVGVYVVGVTIFARTDAHTSSRGRLVAGMTVLLAGMALLAAVPALTENQPRLVVGQTGWFLLWTVLALVTGRRCVSAVLDPSPTRVQAAVRHCVQSIIVLDAAATVGYAGSFWGLAVLALIVPTLLLAACLKAT